VVYHRSRSLVAGRRKRRERNEWSDSIDERDRYGVVGWLQRATVSGNFRINPGTKLGAHCRNYRLLSGKTI